MRLAVAGTHSSGKTTFAAAWSERFGVPFLRDDSVRRISAELGHLGRLDELPPSLAPRVQELFLAEFRSKEGAAGVSDGVPMSCLPYGAALMGEGFEAVRDRLALEANRLTDGFDAILHLPPEFPMADDGFRPLSEDFRLRMDEELLSCLSGRKVRSITGSREDRLRSAAFALGLASLPPRPSSIVLEGLPRSGKTTQLRLLRSALGREGVEARIIARVPVMTESGRTTREESAELYVDPLPNARRLVNLHASTFLAHRSAADADRLESDGVVCLADRQRLSVIAVGCALGLRLGELYAATAALPMPGLVILLEHDPEECVRRAESTGSRNSMKTNLSFQRSVAAAFDELASRHAEVVRIDARRDRERIAAEIRSIALDRIGEALR
jgi:thymidylate kinase